MKITIDNTNTFIINLLKECNSLVNSITIFSVYLCTETDYSTTARWEAYRLSTEMDRTRRRRINCRYKF